MTRLQKNDLLLAKYFIPGVLRHISITEQDEKMYLEWSESGKHKEKLKRSHFDDGFNALVWGKKYQGINLHELWEPGVLEGTMPYYTILGGVEGIRKWYNPMRFFKGIFFNKPVPRMVVDLMKREMFKGIDADTIEKAYASVRV